jgi:putative ABC transport system permease protein
MAPTMQYLTYILAGIRNKFGRNLAAVFCFALIAANVFSGQYLGAGEMESVDQGISRMGADLLVVPLEYTHLLQGADTDNTMAIVAVQPSTSRFDNSVLGDIGRVPGVAGASPQLYVAAVSIPELSASPIGVYGIDPETDFTIRPWLQDPLAAPLGTGEVVIGHDLRRTVGSVFPIAGRSYIVVGVLDPTQSGIDRSVFLSQGDACGLASEPGIVPPGDPRIAAGDVSAVLVRVASGEDPDQVALGITRLSSPPTVTVVARHFSLDPVAQNLQGLPGFLNIISAVVVLAAFPLVALIAAMVANERRREIGLLRAMGAKRSTVLFLVMAESLSLASIGAVAGIGGSLAILSVLEANGVLNSALQVSFRIPAAPELGAYACMAFLVVVAMAGLSSMYPAFRAGRMNPLEAIRWEGK